MKRHLISFITFVLTLGVFYFPSDSVEAHKHSRFIEQYEQLDAEKKQQVDEILDNLHAEIEKLGIHLPHPNVHKSLSQLDETTKEKVKEIIKELEEGKISAKEADAQLEQLGVGLEKRSCNLFEGLDDETEKKAKEILKEKKNGKITHEEAKEKLKELGVDLPKQMELDEETKEKIKQLVEEAEAEFEKLGIEFPAKKYKWFLN